MNRNNVKRCIRIIIGRYSPNDYVYLGRKINGGIKQFFLKYKSKCIKKCFSLEISNFDNIGENLVLAHGSGITVNDRAKIGRNCVIFKNATIGSVRSGRRAGVPIIGDNCVIGVGAFVCGGIHIGNNVLICANSFVDFDVPDNSIVIGNPEIIHYKKDATKDYMGIDGD